MKLPITIFLLTLVIAAAAQISKRGYFQVSATSGCAPFEVEIVNFNVKTNGECTTTRPCIRRFKDESLSGASQEAFKYTYEKSGVYTVRVYYQSIGEDSIVITVKENLPPQVTVRPCSSTTIKLDAGSSAAYDYYKVSFDNNPTEKAPAQNDKTHSADMVKSFLPNTAHTVVVSGVYTDAIENCKASTLAFTLQEPPPPLIKTLNSQLPNVITFQLAQPAPIDFSIEKSTNSDTGFSVLTNNFQGDTYHTTGFIQDNFYCYRIHTRNPCTNVDIFSNTICTQNFSVETLADKNRLRWATLSNHVQNFTIKEDSRAMAENGIVPPTASFFDDNTINQPIGCKIKSTYQLIAAYTDGSISASYKIENIQSKLIRTNAPVSNISAIASPTEVALEWLTDAPFMPTPDVFTLYRSVKGAPYRTIGTLDANQSKWKFIDKNYKEGIPTCYQISYDDGCENISARSVTACVIQPRVVRVGAEMQINWNAYSGFQNARYRLVKTTENGTVLAEENVETHTFYLDEIDKKNGAIAYSVFADPLDAVLPSAKSDVILHRNTAVVFFPNAFTPDDDKLNDTFYAQGLFFTKVIFFVYDRWGTLVYQTNNNEPWDGTRNGAVLPPSVYAWRAEVIDLDGQSKEQRGVVYMLCEKKL